MMKKREVTLDFDAIWVSEGWGGDCRMIKKGKKEVCIIDKLGMVNKERDCEWYSLKLRWRVADEKSGVFEYVGEGNNEFIAINLKSLKDFRWIWYELWDF